MRRAVLSLVTHSDGVRESVEQHTTNLPEDLDARAEKLREVKDALTDLIMAECAPLQHCTELVPSHRCRQVRRMASDARRRA